MINRYDQQLNLNSRAIRDIAVNLTSSNFKMDKVCDQFVDYILENHEHVTGDTVEKVFGKFLQTNCKFKLFLFLRC